VLRRGGVSTVIPGICAWTDWERRTHAIRKSREKMRLCNGTGLEKEILLTKIAATERISAC
jgi:hypothetical protein